MPDESVGFVTGIPRQSVSRCIRAAGFPHSLRAMNGGYHGSTWRFGEAVG